MSKPPTILCDAGHDATFGAEASFEDDAPNCCYVGEIIWEANVMRGAAHDETDEDGLRSTVDHCGEHVIDTAIHLSEHLRARARIEEARHAHLLHQ